MDTSRLEPEPESSFLDLLIEETKIRSPPTFSLGTVARQHGEPFDSLRVRHGSVVGWG